jgi:hypothetical protein
MNTMSIDVDDIEGPDTPAAELAALRAAVEGLTGQVQELRRELAGTRELAEAAVRRLALDPERLPWPQRLTARRFASSSQRGEDGLILALLHEGAEKTRRFVELGCGDNGGNSGFLARELGWTGAMVDGGGDDVQALRRELGPRGVLLKREWITCENVDDLLRALKVDDEVDLLSIDIDGNDLWIWEAVTACSPRVVAIEYNTALGAERSVAVPYDPAFRRDPRRVMGRYFGASLEALARVGRRKGYRLVACENVNAFFLRDGVARGIPEVPVRKAWRLYEKDAVRLRKLGNVYDVFEREGLELVEID